MGHRNSMAARCERKKERVRLGALITLVHSLNIIIGHQIAMRLGPKCGLNIT
jgi:hypothetical protein